MVITLGCGVLAVVMRFARVGGVAGLRGYGGYDDGVYIAAATALVHGRVPYRDFLFLHPPGVVLALAPVASLTHVVSDPSALALARLCVIAVGALNTVLVVLVAAPLGRRAAVTAGVLYALVPVATQAESLTFLEPFGTTALLGAVLLARRAERPHAGPWTSFAAGLVLGVAPVTKIWGLSTVAVVLAWHGFRLGRPAFARAAAGVVTTTVVVCAPFAVLAGGAMWQDVVVAQLARRDASGGMPGRIEALAGGVDAQPPALQRAVLAALLMGAVVLCAIVCWRARRGRLWVVLVTAHGAVLLSAPVFYARYGALAAPSLVLLVASAVATAPSAVRSAMAVCACAAMAVAAGASPSPTTTTRFPAAAARDLLPSHGCVRSDSPGALMLLDVFSQDLARGCVVQVDLSGLTYRHPTRTDAGPAPRSANPLYQRAASDYLTSSTATVLVRRVGDGFSSLTWDRLYTGRTLHLVGGYVRVLVRRAFSTPPHAHGP